MAYLLDTHAVIWYLEDSFDLPVKIKDIIDDSKNKVCICAVSLWEIVIKVSLNKLVLHSPLDEALTSIKNGEFDILQIEETHLKELSKLPFLHKDPFDRLIISTALCEDLTIITVDDNIHRYGASWIW